jgi:hypothetical protein
LSLPWTFAFAITLSMQVAFACGAKAQMTVVSKTATETPVSSFLGGMKGLQAAPESCAEAETNPAACSSATSQEVIARRAASTGSGDIAVLLSAQAGNAVSPQPQGQDTVALERLFQLSDKTEWRIAAGEDESPNQVGVFASQKLWQSENNTSLKFDAGVNVEAKTGSTAGLAGFVMAW